MVIEFAHDFEIVDWDRLTDLLNSLGVLKLHRMPITPQTQHDWTVHSINIHGIFFERWCQHVVTEADGWNLDAVNYPVEFPPPNGPWRGKESTLDIRASREIGDHRICLLCKTISSLLISRIGSAPRSGRSFGYWNNAEGATSDLDLPVGRGARGALSGLERTPGQDQDLHGDSRNASYHEPRQQAVVNSTLFRC